MYSRLIANSLQAEYLAGLEESCQVPRGRDHWPGCQPAGALTRPFSGTLDITLRQSLCRFSTRALCASSRTLSWFTERGSGPQVAKLTVLRRCTGQICTRYAAPFPLGMSSLCEAYTGKEIAAVSCLHGF